MAHTILTVVSSYSRPVLSLLPLTSRTGSRRYYVPVLAVFLAATAVVLGGLRAGAARIEPATKNEPAAFEDFSGKRLAVARITLSPKGFAPAQITRPEGPFILAIHNRSKIDDLTLSLAKVAGNKLREMKVHSRKLDWRSFVTLPPGDYALSVAGHPEWACKIKIKGN